MADCCPRMHKIFLALGKKKKNSVIFVMIRNVFILGLEKHKQNVIVTKEIIGILWFKMVTAIATSTIL